MTLHVKAMHHLHPLHSLWLSLEGSCKAYWRMSNATSSLIAAGLAQDPGNPGPVAHGSKCKSSQRGLIAFFWDPIYFIINQKMGSSRDTCRCDGEMCCHVQRWLMNESTYTQAMDPVKSHERIFHDRESRLRVWAVGRREEVLAQVKMPTWNFMPAIGFTKPKVRHGHVGHSNDADYFWNPWHSEVSHCCLRLHLLHCCQGGWDYLYHWDSSLANDLV